MGTLELPITERILAGLDPEQRAAASAVRGPVCILAGAGTGKTRAITHRIAYSVHSGAVPAGQLLAVTFTARAAGEMRTRLRGLGVGGVQARTFHAFALRQLQFFAPRVLGGQVPEIVDRPLRLVANAAARARLRADRAEVRDLAAEIDWAKAVLAAPADYPARAAAAGRETPTTPATVAEVYEKYEEAKRRAGQLDFSDLLLIMSSALETYADVAEQVRSRYRHFVVDEYQDVSPLQQRLLDAWLGGRDDLCVVGDPNQTIYSFAGATPTHLTGFRGRYPGAQVIRLQRDYRSTPQVVELANKLMVRSTGAGVTLIGQRADGPRPTFAEFDDEPAEAATTAAACARLIADGTPASEIAVLFRINAQSEVYEQALSEAGVPYVLRGGERFFDRPEVREARLLLRGAARADSEGESLPDEVPRRARQHGLESVQPAARGCRAGTVGVPRRAGDPGRGSAGHPTRGEPDRTRRRARPTGHGAARADRPGRHARIAPLGQGAGVGRGVPRRPDRHHPADPARDHARRRSRRSGACSTSASPGRASGWRCPGRWPARPGSGVVVAPAGSSTVCARAAARLRWPRPSRARRAPPPRTPSCSDGCGRGAASRPTPRECRPTWCSPTPRSSRSRTRTPARTPPWRRSPAWVRPSSTAMPNRCWRCWPEAIPTRSQIT